MGRSIAGAVLSHLRPDEQGRSAQQEQDDASGAYTG
jgi:hypothetical protein